MKLQSIATLSLVPWFGVSSSTSRVTHPRSQPTQVETSEDSSIVSSQNDSRFNPATSYHSNKGVPNVLYNQHTDRPRRGLRKAAQRDLLHDKLDDKKETNYERTTSSEEKKDPADIGILTTSSSSTTIEQEYYYNHDTQTSRNLALTADPSSCNSTNSCSYAGNYGNATVGVQSCNANRACQSAATALGAIALIGDNSCNAKRACFGIVALGTGTIQDNSCNAEYACYAAGGLEGGFIIYDNSCNARLACARAADSSNAYANIGPGSCNGNSACQFLADPGRAVVGADSCNGKSSCLGYSSTEINVYIGDRSCLGESSCAFLVGGEFTIGDDSCSCDACCQDIDPGSVIGDCQCNDPCNPCTGYINNSTSACTDPLPDPEDREKTCPSSAPSLSSAPSNPPSASASPSYSASPTRGPSESPSQRPSESPSLSSSPSDGPSTSLAPTNEPTSSMSPSQNPSIIPTVSPSAHPTSSVSPSELASATPSQSASPSQAPSHFPSEVPTSAPLVCGSTVIPGNSCLALECCDSATNAVGSRCCGTTPYDDALEQCCADSLSVVPIGDDCPSSSPDKWCTLVADEDAGCGDGKILTCTKHYKDEDDYHFHEQCTKEEDLVGIPVGGFIDSDRQLTACGCCLDDPMILQKVNLGDVDLKVAKSTKKANCPEPNLIL